jgi:hypothetical protein
MKIAKLALVGGADHEWKTSNWLGKPASQA